MSGGFKVPQDVILTLILSIVSAIFIFVLPDGNLLRVIFSIPFLLLCPGYSLVSALWPQRNNLDDLERLVIAIGLSIVLVSVIGLVILYLSMGFNYVGLTAPILIASIVSLIIGTYRRSMLATDERYHFDIREYISVTGLNHGNKVAVAGLSLVIILSGCGIGYLMITPSPGEYYSELFILDADRTANNYPVNISTNQTHTVVIGIVSHEASRMNYSILSGNGNTTNTIEVGDWTSPLVFSENDSYARNITLDPGTEVDENFNFVFTLPGTYKLQWTLVPEQSDIKYDVHLWITVNP